MPKTNFNELNWDVINLILRFTPRHQCFPVLRGVSKQFYFLISKKRMGITFAKGDITSKMFFNIVEKSKNVQTLAIKCRDMKFISPTSI